MIAGNSGGEVWIRSSGGRSRKLQARPRGEVVKMSDCEHRCRQGRRHQWVVRVGKMDFAVDQVIMDLGVESRLDLGHRPVKSDQVSSYWRPRSR